MFTIDLILRNTPMPLSVQRKSEEEAQATYQEILTAMRSGHPKLLELSCDHQPEKKIGVLSDQISAAMISQKSGATGSGRTPGFFAMAE
ncbi:MAG: hypothetical protein F6J90_12600 [Moorea sp. SIOASIH]|uniref:UPF0367 protein BJP36_04745 n=1 Tax=Moorena producens (strain JHB) TaxID=1454205 RepID=A0A1D9FVH9_MOOP1|nr:MULTISPECIES: hypothetical protein [Moorena]AOY79325.1 hypothetical protein BJP36_04745 [Moorena producens JHB]NEO37106.1 hypothetical protein [Moorena sp. SIOASIH]NEO95714.1 hypothetical protein [Moorena sp. SIO3G5]